jgi:hypothetical protein
VETHEGGVRNYKVPNDRHSFNEDALHAESEEYPYSAQDFGMVLLSILLSILFVSIPQ